MGNAILLKVWVAKIQQNMLRGCIFKHVSPVHSRVTEQKKT